MPVNYSKGAVFCSLRLLEKSDLKLIFRGYMLYALAQVVIKYQ